MKQYDKYKDSGIAWIGKLPEHWETRILSQVATEYFISNKEIKHQNLLSLSYGRIITPLIFSSLERIDTIATAMELRRFGKEKKRTWYSYQALKKGDYLTVLVAILFVVASLLLILQNHGRFYNPWK